MNNANNVHLGEYIWKFSDLHRFIAFIPFALSFDGQTFPYNIWAKKHKGLKNLATKELTVKSLTHTWALITQV